MIATSFVIACLAAVSTIASPNLAVRQDSTNATSSSSSPSASASAPVASANVTVPTNSTGLTLAVSPKCGSLSGNFADVNAGLKTDGKYTTIVAFGDGFTDGGVQNGGELLPAVLQPPNPKAGNRTCNGPVWVENLAASTGAKLQDFAALNAVTDNTLWPATDVKAGSDLVNQTNEYIGLKGAHDPASTLYAVFFGHADFEQIQGNQTLESNMKLAADTVVQQVATLASSPTFAKDILVLDNTGAGNSSATIDAYKQTIFAALNTLRTQNNVNVGFVDFHTLYAGVKGSTPGFAAFGYTSAGACLTNPTTTEGACASPDTTFEWIPGYPSKVTQKLMSDYVMKVLSTCTA